MPYTPPLVAGMRFEGHENARENRQAVAADAPADSNGPEPAPALPPALDFDQN